jgi:magnesium chelatase family protein
LVDYKALASAATGEGSDLVRDRVQQARLRQAERFAASPGVNTNSAMPPRLLKTHCQLDSEGAAYLEHAMGDMHFSARAHDRILKVARTLADLAGSDRIRPNDILEAIGYRSLDRNLWV